MSFAEPEPPFPGPVWFPKTGSPGPAGVRGLLASVSPLLDLAPRVPSRGFAAWHKDYTLGADSPTGLMATCILGLFAL